MPNYTRKSKIKNESIYTGMCRLHFKKSLIDHGDKHVTWTKKTHEESKAAMKKKNNDQKESEQREMEMEKAASKGRPY